MLGSRSATDIDISETCSIEVHESHSKNGSVFKLGHIGNNLAANPKTANTIGSKVYADDHGR